MSDYVHTLERYYADLYGWEVEKEGNGFIAYFINGKDLWICEMYVPPEERPNGTAKKLVNSVVDTGLENGCEMIYGQVEVKKNGNYALHPAVNLTIFLGHGMLPIEAHNNKIVMAKKIGKF